jgi:hypothetical protein
MAFGLATWTTTSGGLDTDVDEAIREDLLDIITDVSPDDNPLATMFGRSKASQVLHQWLEDYISRKTSQSTSIEGAAASYADLTQPQRRANWCEIIEQTYRVSGTERDVDHAGMGDSMDYQAGKALREWKNQLEYDIVNGTLASGSSGVARAMAGLDSVVTSHYTNRNSGSSLSETVFNDHVRTVWNDVGQADVFDTVITTFQLKQKISTFTAGSTKYVDASDKRLTRPVQVYESDGGVHRIFAHKDVPSAVATPGPRFFGIKEDKYRLAYLRPPKRQKLSKDGDRDNGHIIGEVTLEYLAERTSIRSSGYAQGG